MAGFENDVLLLKNINFDYTSAPPHSGIVVANGQVLIGTTTNPDIAMVANTLTAGTGISITNGPGTITIASSSGGVSVDSFDVQASTAPGTDPVVPTAAGLVTVNGAAVANHSVVLETRSRAANAYNVEVQYATSAAATDATKSGVAHYNSAQFSVDANGFVSVISGGFQWNDVTSATQTITAENGYVTDRGAGVTYTLPASGTFGDEFIITGKLGLWTLAQNANQQVTFSSSSSTVGVGGSLAATNLGDSIWCVCTTAGASTIWRVFNSVGNITVT